MFFVPASRGQGPSERQRCIHYFCKSVRYWHIIQTGREGVCLMHTWKSLDVRRKPAIQETHRGRKALSDGFSWITGSQAFSLLPVAERDGQRWKRLPAAASVEISARMPCGLGTGKLKKQYCAVCFRPCISFCISFH